MSKEQQQHLEELQDAAFEAGKEGKKALLARMNIRPEEKKKKDPTKMYRNQLLSMMDNKDGNPYFMAKGNACGLHDKDVCETVSGCKWYNHNCHDTRMYQK